MPPKFISAKIVYRTFHQEQGLIEMKDYIVTSDLTSAILALACPWH